MMGFPGGTVVKNLPANAGDTEEARLLPGMRRSPGVGNGHPLQYSLSGKVHGQRSLVGCSPWDLKELDMTENKIHARDDDDFFLILMTPINYSLDSVNCCPNSMPYSPLLTPLHEYTCPLSLKLTKFFCSGRHCFGKDPQCPYLLQVIINPSFSQSLACIFWL